MSSRKYFIAKVFYCDEKPEFLFLKFFLGIRLWHGGSAIEQNNIFLEWKFFVVEKKYQLENFVYSPVCRD
jgi:hypothetical protein